MNKKSPAFSSGNRLQPFLGFLRTSGNKGWDYITLGTVGVFILAIIIVGFWMWSATKIKIHYTPADIVYGVEFMLCMIWEPTIIQGPLEILLRLLPENQKSAYLKNTMILGMSMRIRC
jgi:hypothetical protein